MFLESLNLCTTKSSIQVLVHTLLIWYDQAAFSAF